ncbi:MAG: hypothetical protein ACRDL7_07385, partial [Gaiellaceae bacterium]
VEASDAIPASPAPSLPIMTATPQRYWDTQNSNSIKSIVESNTKLLDHAVGTIANMYYDNSGGSKFSQEDFYENWKVLKSRSAYDNTCKINNNNFQGRNDKTHKNNQCYDAEDGITSAEAKKKATTTKPLLTDDDINRFITSKHLAPPPLNAFTSRENAVLGLRWLVVSSKRLLSRIFAYYYLLQIKGASFPESLKHSKLVKKRSPRWMIHTANT